MVSLLCADNRWQALFLHGLIIVASVHDIVSTNELNANAIVFMQMQIQLFSCINNVIISPCHTTIRKHTALPSFSHKSAMEQHQVIVNGDITI